MFALDGRMQCKTTFVTKSIQQLANVGDNCDSHTIITESSMLFLYHAVLETISKLHLKSSTMNITSMSWMSLVHRPSHVFLSLTKVK